MSNNSVENSLQLIEQYSAAARDSMGRITASRTAERADIPVRRSNVSTIDTPYTPDQYAAISARAAIIARGERATSIRQPNVLKRDQEHKDFITRLAIGGSAVLFAAGLYLGASKAVEALNDRVDHFSVMDTSDR